MNGYDRKIETGNEFQKDINNNLSKADIICLMISHNFLSSEACMKEKGTALQLKNEKGIRIIPIILSPCLWTEDKNLSKLLAVSTAGTAITSFADQKRTGRCCQGDKKRLFVDGSNSKSKDKK